MDKPPLIALLAGARETPMAAKWLAQTPGVSAVVVWARGMDRTDLGLVARDAVPGDAAGILDVTHAFDTGARAAAMAQAPRAAYARVGRDPWTAHREDHWREVDTIAEAVSALPARARVFAATGRASLPALGTHDGPVFLRQLTRHDQPTGFPNCTYIFGAAPFDIRGEVTLFEQLEIDVVLARNVGGIDSFPKLAAARALGLPAVLLRPPPLPPGPRLRNVTECAAWIGRL